LAQGEERGEQERNFQLPGEERMMKQNRELHDGIAGALITAGVGLECDMNPV